MGIVSMQNNDCVFYLDFTISNSLNLKIFIPPSTLFPLHETQLKAKYNPKRDRFILRGIIAPFTVLPVRSERYRKIQQFGQIHCCWLLIPRQQQPSHRSHIFALSRRRTTDAKFHSHKQILFLQINHHILVFGHKYDFFFAQSKLNCLPRFNVRVDILHTKCQMLTLFLANELNRKSTKTSVPAYSLSVGWSKSHWPD